MSTARLLIEMVIREGAEVVKRPGTHRDSYAWSGEEPTTVWDVTVPQDTDVAVQFAYFEDSDHEAQGLEALVGASGCSTSHAPSDAAAAERLVKNAIQSINKALASATPDNDFEDVVYQAVARTPGWVGR